MESTDQQGDPLNPFGRVALAKETGRETQKATVNPSGVPLPQLARRFRESHSTVRWEVSVPAACLMYVQMYLSISTSDEDNMCLQC